uniref:M-phase phosphoprotein 8 n=1 Tax=Seriola dumerili TaxID=41447 RepID=A0A3B4UJI1_SERDU
MAAETDKVEPADSEQDEEEDVYEVERIIDMRVEEGEVLYRVRWKNYCSDDDTWEPEAHLEDCREVLLAFKKSLADAKAKKEAEAKKSVKLLPTKSDVFDADSESDSDKDPPAEAPIKKKKKKKIREEEDEPPPKDKKKKKKEKRKDDVRPVPAPETDEEEEEERAPTPPSSPKEKKTESKKRLVDSDEDDDEPVPSKKHKKEKGKEGAKHKKEKGEDGKKRKGKKERKIETSEDEATAPLEDYLSDGPSESQMDDTTSSDTVTKSAEKARVESKQKKGKWEVKLQGIKDLIQDKKSKKPDAAQKESSLQKLKNLTSKSKEENAPHSDSSDSSILHKKAKSKGQECTSAPPKAPSSSASSSSSSSVTAASSVKVKEEEVVVKEEVLGQKDTTGSTNLFEKFLLNCEAKDRAPRRQPVHQPPVEKTNSKPAKMALRHSAAEALEQSEDDCSFSSDESNEDSEEEHYHFELRLDPAEDDCDENWENIAPAKKKAQCQPSQQPQSWKTESDDDVAPPPLEFLPVRGPGVQLNPKDKYTPLDLFKLFFSEEAMKTVCQNTNKKAAKHTAKGAKYKWMDVGVTEFYSYIGLIFYMAIIKLDSTTDYWRKNNIFSVFFPSQVMTRDRYQKISWNIHMSDPDEDRVNDAKRGTSEHDRLFRVKPLMCTIQDAFKVLYHPRRNLAVHDQYTRTTPNKSCYRLIALTDSSNGYTVGLTAYTGKNDILTVQRQSYDCVMSLIDRRYLGSGYHVYMDSFYTSPKLFMDLFDSKYGACGTYRDSRRSCPRSTVNALSNTSPRGMYRWIRDGPLLFVKWMDAQEVSVCSTIHTACTVGAVQRRVRSRQGVWTTESFPCPSPVMEYNKLMVGVDLPDQFIQHLTIQHKTLKWYKKVFLQFLDIAAHNAYILHKELLQEDTMTHKAFMEELTAQLCGVTQNIQKTPAQTERVVHMPVPGSELPSDCRMRASAGRKTCVYCRRQRGKQIKTPWKCKACDVYLCLQLDRNCFEAWHPDKDG